MTRGRAIGDVERYEQLRARALGGEPSGWRLGLALLERRGRRRVDARVADHGSSARPARRPAARGRCQRPRGARRRARDHGARLRVAGVSGRERSATAHRR